MPEFSEKTFIIKIVLFIILGSLYRPVNAGEIGWATFYTVASAKAEGKSGVLTASGRRYNEAAMTCALPAATAKAWGLKYGQSVRVTNLEQGRTISVTYLDRGPGHKARAKNVVIDLSPAAYLAIGGRLKDGLVQVRVEGIKP